MTRHRRVVLWSELRWWEKVVWYAYFWRTL